MRGNKTTAIDQVKYLNKILKKHGIEDVSYGIIVSVKNRRDHKTTIKIASQKGNHLVTVTTKLYKQEFRIYDDVSSEVLRNILKQNLGEQYRVL